MMQTGKFKSINNKIDFVQLEHDVLDKWENEETFERLREKNAGG